jgi:hypothetical protein
VAIDRALSEVDDTSGISGIERIVAQALAGAGGPPAEAIVALRPSAEGTPVPPAAYAQSAGPRCATVGERRGLALADEVTCGAAPPTSTN